MNSDINFTVGFSHGVEWGWPIAVYLLLAGIAGGATIVSLMIRYYKKQKEDTPLLKAASLVAFITICIGMVFLVGDLDRPLYFWKILINYNMTSVMSIGVIAISVYIPLSLVMCMYVFEKEILSYIPKGGLQKLFSVIMNILKIIRPFIEGLAIIAAFILLSYTGFLISVLVRFPILSTAILPALFVASGLSVGTAASSMFAALFFKEDTHSHDLKTLHTIEWPIMATEAMFIGMLFVSLLIGNEFQQTAVPAFTNGAFSSLFWVGVIGIGFMVPLLLNFGFGKKVASSHVVFYFSCAASIIGVLCLRIFIIYAGQTFGV